MSSDNFDGWDCTPNGRPIVTLLAATSLKVVAGVDTPVALRLELAGVQRTTGGPVPALQLALSGQEARLLAEDLLATVALAERFHPGPASTN